MSRPEVVVPGRRHRLLALGEEDELAVVGQQQVAELADHLGVERPPTEHVAVEGVDLVAELLGEGAPRERELHVVEPHLRHGDLPIR